MKRIHPEDYFDEMTEVLKICVVCVPYAFFAGWIIYGITWRILRAFEKPNPDHLYWWIMLVFGVLIVGFIIVNLFICLINLLAAIFRRAAILRECKTKGHDWDSLLHCRRCGKVQPHEHNWDGCRCTLCGEVRNEGHDWNGCKCIRCGTKRDEGHDWNGCKCVRCGTKRNERHDWKIEACPNCGGSGYVTRTVSSAVAYQEYSWDDYEEPCGCEHPLERVCTVCGKREDVSEQK